MSCWPGGALLPLRRIAQLVAQAPAASMGLAHRKGRIAVGLDADLAPVGTGRLCPDGSVADQRNPDGDYFGSTPV